MTVGEIRKLLKNFSDAWWREDFDEVMSLFSDDCIYRASVGLETGKTCVGKALARQLTGRTFDFDEEEL